MEITENQFYQLFGLVTASIQLDTKRTILHEAFCEIVGESPIDEGRFYDWGIGEEPGLEAKMRKAFAFDGIIIKKEKK